MNYKKLESMVKNFCDESNISQAEFCNKVGISPQGLNNLFKKEGGRIDTLEKISKGMNVSPCIFLDESYRIDDNYKVLSTVSEEKGNYAISLQEKLKRLEAEMKLKDDLIRTYHQLISNKELNKE